MIVRLLAAAAGLALVLTGCTALGPTADAVPAGTCLAEYNRYDSDRASIVECTEKHAFDVYATALWPEMAAAIAKSDAGAVFDSIQSDEGSEVTDPYWDWAYDECELRFLEYIGLDTVMIEGKSAHELGMLPGGLWSIDYSLGTREAFVEGDQTTLCSLKWYDVDGEPQLVAYEDGVSPASMLTDFAPELQGCFIRDTEAEVRYVRADCSGLHNGQYLMYFDLLAALGSDFVETMNPETTLFADYDPFDDYCTTVIDTVYPGVLDSESWIVWSDQTGAFQGWEDFDGTADPEQIYPAYCGIFAQTLTIKGDVISGGATASLIIG